MKKVMCLYRSFVLLLIFIPSGLCFGQSLFAEIPDTLIKNAKAVSLYYGMEVEFHSKSKYTTTVIQKILLLDKNCEEAQNLFISYDKLIKVDNVEITVRDTSMKVIKKYSRNDMSDHAFSDAVSLVTDDRFIAWKATQLQVPCIIEYKYKTTSNQTFNIPSFSPVTNHCISVLHAEFKVINRIPGNKIYFNRHIYPPPKVDVLQGESRYYFSFKNIAAGKKQNATNNNDLFIRPALTEFSMDDVDGNRSTWADFGDWMYRLNEGRNTLSEKAVAEIKRSVPATADTLALVRNLYRYMQNSTRYVGVQLGVGGWKAFPAQYVFDNKYGDCKALTNYMKTLLALYSIESFYTLIYAGDESPALSEDIVNHQFNHVILTVPLQKDTMFLECTADNYPAGYTGTLTSNRKALMVNGQKSGLVSITNYHADNNSVTNHWKITPDKNKSLVVLMQNTVGIANELYGFMHYYGKQNDISPDLLKSYFCPQCRSVKLRSDTLLVGGKFPLCSLQAEFEEPDKIKYSANRYFVNMGLNEGLNRIIMEYDNVDMRKIIIGYSVIDTIDVTVPAGCTPEKLPKAYDLVTDAGKIHAFQESNGNMVRYICEFTLNAGQKKDTLSLEELFAVVRKVMAEKLVLKCQVNP